MHGTSGTYHVQQTFLAGQRFVRTTANAPGLPSKAMQRFALVVKVEMAPPTVFMPVQAERPHTRDRGILAAVFRIHRMLDSTAECLPNSVGELFLPGPGVCLDIGYQHVGVGEGDKRGEGSEGGLEMHGKAKSGSVRKRSD